MLSLLSNNLGGTFEKDLLSPEMQAFSLKWTTYERPNDHVLMSCTGEEETAGYYEYFKRVDRAMAKRKLKNDL